MVRRRKNRWRGTRRRRTSHRQKGGLLPLAALVPAFISAGKAIGLGALGGGASFGAKKGSRSCHQDKQEKNHQNKTITISEKNRTHFGRAVSSAEKIRKNVLGIS